MLSHLQRKIQALGKFSFKDETLIIIQANTSKLEDLQTRQLYTGLGADSKPLTLDGRGYAPTTIKIKKQKGQPYSFVTWKDTGELYESLTVRVSPTTFGFSSPNFKFKKMILRSGVDAVGLNHTSRKEFIETVTRPGILDVYRKKVSAI